MRKIPALLLASSILASGSAAHALTVDEAKKIALDAYVYGYSLITTDVTRVQMTNVPAVEELRAPMGHFANVKRYPPADYRGVSAPNADTLYSLAWIDVGSEPWVFTYPDMGDRYVVFPMYDLWMPVVFSGGSRTTGGASKSFLLTGPGWKGTVPDGMTQVEMPTRYMLILGRTYADGTDADYAKVNALQAQYDIRPLSAVGKADYVAPIAPVADPGFSMTDKPQKVILDFGTEGYFDRLAKLMCHDAPPAAADAPILAEMAKIGVEPCKDFHLAALGPDVAKALEGLPQQALDYLGAHQTALGTEKDGWLFTKGLGQYGTDYLKRGLVAAFGWPANLQEDAVYPYTTVDSDGKTLTGASKYTLTFAKGELPPVNGFWSITMYQIDQGWWFVPNALNKFTVSPRDHLVPNADGSVTLYFQKDSPGKDKEANWLPAPEGDFIPMLRMYWPEEADPSILNGSWTPPRVKKAG
ncbi:MAG: DUF1254 domain-containing protein [Amaricoccus sp.]